MSGQLGRIAPPDFEHVEKYPLAALAQAAPVNVPVAIGINWYSNFDTPERQSDGTYLIGRGKLGTIRGGHCVCLEPATRGEVDAKAWWTFYNQGQEGSCEGHGHSRMASLLFRKRFDAVWLYNEARKIDGDPDPNHEGTTNRAALEVLRTQGHRVAHGTVTTALTSSDKVAQKYGCAAYRWATSAEQIAAALGLDPKIQYVTLLNSWGTEYPERVRLPLDTLHRLVNEAGEAGVITER